MGGISNFALVSVVLILFVASLWYFFQTIRVMWRYNFLVAIIAIFFVPLVHIIFYFFPKSGFNSDEREPFKKYFLSIVAIIVLGISVSVVVPTLEYQDLGRSMSDGNTEINSEINKDTESEPWEWDIRAEDLE